LSTPVQNALRAAETALRNGALAEARQYLLPVQQHPAAIHLMGLVAKAAGDLTAASQLLARAAAALPTNADIANEQGIVARLRGNFDQAETAFRRALTLRPGDTSASLGLARTFVEARRWSDAEAQYRQVLQRTPNSAVARYGLAGVKLEQGATEDAEAGFDALVRGGDHRPSILFMRGRARLELGRIDEGIADLRTACAREVSPETFTTLAGALWMSGQTEAFEALLHAATARPDLIVTAAELRRQSGAPAEAVALLDGAAAGGTLPADADAVKALALIDLDDAAAAEQAARRSLAAHPVNEAARAALASALLMQGQAGAALDFVRDLRNSEPERQHWIAYEATALRLLGDSRYAALVDYDRFVHVFDLPVPPGYADIESFNQALRQELERWHVFPMRPLDQSLRHGSQTPRDLSGIDSPAIRAYVEALETPIRQYLDAIGNDPRHPLTRRNGGGFRLAGCWSVKLFGGGHHICHVHPEGWISSAYYVTVPKEQSEADRSGWIRFGEPPFQTRPALTAEHWVAPRAGRLVLFPSYLWHGTLPTAPDTVRMTAPFDVVPAEPAVSDAT
jgi:uncharacterized protein (TIGR02466 family)